MFYSFLEFFSAPTFFLDGSGEVMTSNSTGQAELKLGRLLGVDEAGCLCLVSDRGNRELVAAIASVRSAMSLEPGRNKSTSFVVDAEEDRPRVVVHVLGLGGTVDTVAVMLPSLLVNQDAARMRSVLAALYGLTPAEARLAAAMVAGHTSGADLAAVLGRSEWTIRSQIRGLFLKLDVSTKTDAINRMSLDVLPMNIEYCLPGGPNRAQAVGRASSAP